MSDTTEITIIEAIEVVNRHDGVVVFGGKDREDPGADWPPWVPEFLKALASGSRSVEQAAATVAVSRSSVYRLKNRDVEFAKALTEAKHQRKLRR